MAGNPGCEFFGPWDEGPAVKEAILEAGSALDLKRVGSLAYFTNALELGWIPRPVPAIFTGDELRPFREWLPATASEATWAIGGSFNAPEIQDYYFTPWELGYGNVIKFDHDFVGREALERTAGDDHRRKVTLVWDPADVAAVFESYMKPDELPGALPRVAAGDVCDLAVRRGPRRPGTNDRGLDLRRLHLERAVDGLARDRRSPVRRAWDTRLGDLGRTRRRRQEPSLVGRPTARWRSAPRSLRRRSERNSGDRTLGATARRCRLRRQAGRLRLQPWGRQVEAPTEMVRCSPARRLCTMRGVLHVRSRCHEVEAVG